MQNIRHITDQLLSARSLGVLTGAGISAESGVPTFRGSSASGVWKGMPFDQISSARMLAKDLPEVWNWFNYRRDVLRKCNPNKAHEILVKWEKRFEAFTLITQNVDGLHIRAGSMNLIEIHGNINRSRCTKCSRRFQMGAGDIPHEPQLCTSCKSKLRPDVILFGESLPEGAFESAVDVAQKCDLFIVIGTSALVQPAASLPGIALRHGAFVFEINPEVTPLTEMVDASLQLNAVEALEKIDEGLFS